MPKFGTYEERRFPTTLTKLASEMYVEISKLKIAAWRTPEPVPFEQRKTGEFLTFTIGEKWGNLWDCAWFHFTGQIPESAEGQHVVLLLDINGEMCVFDENGNPVRGLTNMDTTYDPTLGGAGKHVLQITKSAKGNNSISVWIDAGCNDLFGNLIEDGKIKEAGIDYFTAHDLRRSAATGMAILGHAAVIGDILNHAPQGITRTVYDKYDREPEIKRALISWETAIKEALAGGGRKVVEVNF